MTDSFEKSPGMHNLGVASGVRPSSDAVTSEAEQAGNCSVIPQPHELAAPGDGRIPQNSCATTAPAWFCLRSHPKHEHIAAAQLRQIPGVEVFNPQLQLERLTRRGRMRSTESLFVNYLFARFVLETL